MTTTVISTVKGTGSFDVMTYLEGLADKRISYCAKYSKFKALNLVVNTEVGVSITVKEDRDIEVATITDTASWKTCGSSRCFKLSLNHIFEAMTIDYVLDPEVILTVDFICN